MKRNRSRDSGVVAVMAGFLMLVLGAFMALVLNIGFAMDTRAELQNASDSAALAAALTLDGTATGLVQARAMAEQYSNAHNVTKEAVQISQAEDVILGRWHFNQANCVFGGGSDCFEPLDGTDPKQVTAVKILNGRDGGTHNAALETYFGFFLGTTKKIEVASAAVAIGAGTGQVDCTLPFILPDCLITDEDGQLLCGSGTPQVVTQFGNDTNDNIGFVDPTGESINNNRAEELIKNCRENGDSVIDEAPVQNGVDLNKKLREALQERICEEGPEQVFAVAPMSCPNPKFNQKHPITGFVKVRILEVIDNSGTTLSCPGAPPSEPTEGGEGPQAKITIEVLCDVPEGLGGGAFFGPAQTVRLVQ